ncbi:MAG: hypothetical protein CML04_01305 [Pseudozobellia sp.]|nr:hypothetical protein [Pseudozobellia sp.]MBG48821.1 hypothetical protein [Pseudozobellia sp.]|tara:strand:- start:918 stop:1184 length:267 start_codon:yes stop_codon:yes gene_type:complete
MVYIVTNADKSLATLEKDIMVLVFKTNARRIHEMWLRKILSGYSKILRIDFDFEDCDNILRVESLEDMREEITLSVRATGLYCKELED